MGELMQLPGERRRASAILIFLFGGMLCRGTSRAEDPSLVAPTPPRSPEEQQKLFHLPPGFEIQLVAAEPDIAKPMNIAFDDRSRIWVTTSVEYPFPAKPGTTPRDSIKILEDTDGDARADVIKTFVDGLNIPIGVLPIRVRPTGSGGRPAERLASGCVAYSIPNIWRFLDSDGDDRADLREVLYSRFGFQDTHGMSSSYTWGFDGWIYATHGFANTSEVKGSDGHVVRMHSGSTYRFRSDGSRIEPWTWGQVNPFGLCFDPLGNLYSADCHSRPIMMLLRGAYYQSFGKPHDGLGFGPEMCAHEHGSTGIAGVVYYAAEQFPPEYRNTIFTGNPVTNRINHDRLEQHGSTFLAVHQPDFLSCDDPWFRPVDLKLGTDGALYVADFYNKIIGHYEVPLTHPGRDRERGRIWRVVYRGENAPVPRMPRKNWETASVGDLIDDLAHGNMVVRTKATNQLADRIGHDAAGPLRSVIAGTANPVQRVHAAWAMERVGALDDQSVASLLDSRDALVETHALMLLGGRRDLSPAMRDAVVGKLRVPDGFVRRAAAATLAQHPDRANLRPLFQLRGDIPADDPQLLHAARLALRDQLLDSEILTEITGGELADETSRWLADVAPGIASPVAAAFLMKHLGVYRESRETTAHFMRHAARNGAEDQHAKLLELARVRAGGDLGDQLALVRALDEGWRGRSGPVIAELREWAEELARRLIGTNEARPTSEALELARIMKLDRLEGTLVAIVADKQSADGHRDAALGALAAINAAGHLALFSRVLGDSSDPVPLRQAAAAHLGGTNRPDARAELIERLRTAPEPVAVHIAAALSANRSGVEELLADISVGRASPRLLQYPLVAGRLEAVAPDLKERARKLTEGLPPAEQRLQKLIDSRRAQFAKAQSNAASGAAIFEKQCGICHTIAGRGSKVGPQLDGIGIRGLDRILEDVLDPNRNVDQAFRSTVIALKNGQLLTGLVLNNEGDVLMLADTEGKEVRVPKSDIEEQKASKLSAMPANVAELVPEAEFFDLIAYLLSQRGATAPDGSDSRP